MFLKDAKDKDDNLYLLCEEDAGVGTSVKGVGGNQLSKMGVQLCRVFKNCFLVVFLFSYPTVQR